MLRPLILTTLLLLVGVVCSPPPTAAADKPVTAVDKPTADKPAAADELGKKFVLVTRLSGEHVGSELLKKVEFRKLGGREFLVGEYCISQEEGVGKEWEGVQLWVPVDGIESMMVFGDEAKAWAAVKASKVKD